MLGLGLGSHKAKAFRSIVAKLYGKLRHRSTYFENNKEGAKDIKDYKLLDKATILLTPTATSDARVNSVKTYTGDELITNGGFDADSNWTLGSEWSISDGKLKGLGAGAFSFASQTISGITNKTLRLTFEILDYVSGTFRVNPAHRADGADIRYSGNGTYEVIYKAANGSFRFQMQEFEGSIDNVSIVDVSSDFDFDRASSATRINSSGLVQDMQSITDPELVLNGNFEELGSDIVTNGDFSDGTNDWNFVRATIDSGGARINNIGLGGANSYVQQLDVLVVGKTYKMQYDIVATNGKDLVLEKANNLSLDATTTGSKTIYFTQATTTALVVKRNVSETDVTIDNIRIEQVDPNDRWTLSSTFEIDNGKLHCVSDGSYQYAYQSNAFVVGNTYKITFDVIDYTSGSIRVRPSGQSGYTAASANGTYTQYFTATDTTLAIERESACNLYVDNVSIKDITFSTDVDLARINYDSNGDNGHILLEPTSTNLITYSEDFSAWTANDVTLGDDVTSPDGTTNATTINVNDASALIYENYTVVASTTYTFSFYVKRGTLDSSSFLLAIYDDSNNAFISENISYTTSTEWTRVEHTFSTPSGCTDVRLYTYRNTSGSTGTFFQWGVQLEELSYATSYIPSLTGSTVTRAAETLLGSGNSTLINSTEGVLYAEIEALVNGGVDRIISLSDETNDNLIYIRIDNTANRINSFARGGGGTYNTLTVNGVNQTNNNKIALVWDASNVRVWINGSQSLTQSINNSPVGMKTLTFTSPTGGNPFYGKCKALAVFNEALSDDELELLTGVTNYPSFGALAAAGGYTII